MLRDNDRRLEKHFKRLMMDFKEVDLIFIKELIDVPATIDNGVYM
jgi:hypothetical protein